jgi:hypothetical protein
MGCKLYDMAGSVTGCVFHQPILAALVRACLGGTEDVYALFSCKFSYYGTILMTEKNRR